MAVIKAVATRQTARLSSGIKYITNPEKTDQLGLVSGKDCNAKTALAEMETTKELHDKTDGRQYKHFIQSFDPKDTIDPEKAHELGREFAEKSFPGHEVLIATHIDKDHIHNHFVVNSVNFENGLKLQSSKDDLKEMKALNDRICEREHLHVLTSGEKIPGKELSMNEYQVAMKGESWKFKLMGEIDRTMETAKSKDEFIKGMEEKGYKVKWTDERKSITYTTPEGRKCRDNKLHDEKYLKEGMEREFSRTKENKLQHDQPGRRPDGQQRSIGDIGTKIIFGQRDTGTDQIPSERNVSVRGTNPQEIRARREDQTGARSETIRERESQSRPQGESQQSIQDDEPRNKGTKGNELQKVGDDLHSDKRGNTQESGNLQQVHPADSRTSLSSEKHPKSKLEGKGETVRSQSPDFNRDDSFSSGRVPGFDHFDEVIKTLENENPIEAEREEARPAQKTQTPKSHQQEDEQER